MRTFMFTNGLVLHGTFLYSCNCGVLFLRFCNARLARSAITHYYPNNCTSNTCKLELQNAKIRFDYKSLQNR